MRGYSSGGRACTAGAWSARLLLAALALLGSPLAEAAGPAGVGDLGGEWSATVQVGAMQVPFRFGLTTRAGQVSGWFYNGSQQVRSARGSYTARHLQLEYPTYARRLEADLAPDGSLSGTYLPTTPGSKARPYPFHAVRLSRTDVAASEHAPRIAGLWLVPVSAGKAGEQAWHFIVRQHGAQVNAAVLRVDGDTGELTGSWRNGKLLLSHFDGARPAVIEVSAAPDETLQLLLRDSHGDDQTFRAYRSEAAVRQALPQAADPARHTMMRDPSEPFRFSFPDLAGGMVSNSDARFRNKVLVVEIGGSWCPNCHDEAPFLQSLYQKYHGRGLEVVTLSFEEQEQLVNPTRLQAFVRDFGITYTVLVAGTPDELHEKVPQAVHLDAYPTTFFIGRDGRVRSVHAGFAAPATGAFNAKLKEDFTRQVQQLLRETPTVK
ncbi:MAG: TlpA family protein disulfide reductase [Sinobacteraceae bacterium]|nr:TlpA family protein disulfide reductase [Nevskiaceae bacterium]